MMENQIFHAAASGKLSLIKKALEHRPKEERVHLLSNKTSGATPLIAACRHGHYDVAEYLIKCCGADVELVGSVIFDGETIERVPPLWCAAAAGHLNIVELLVRNGAEVNSTTKTNSTPLRAACFDGHLAIVKFLIAAGADTEVANRHGHSCLMIACYKNHYDIAKYLVDKGADINRKSLKANTSLHDCAESGAISIMKLLLSKGAKFFKDIHGITPLMAAAVAGNSNIVDYLIQSTCLVSPQEKVDALEVLGATYVDSKKDILAALKLWKRALDLRFQNAGVVQPKPSISSAVYEGRKEAATYADLEELSCDPDGMRMQSLIVRERILGPSHPDTTYYIRYRGAVFADAGQFDRCISLWLYALNMQQKTLDPLSPLTQGSFLSFAELFYFMIADRRNPASAPILKFDDVYVIFCKAAREIELSMQYMNLQEKAKDYVSFHRLLVISLQLLSVLITIEKTPEEDYMYHKMAYKLLRLNARGTNGWTLLHIASAKTHHVGRFAVTILPSTKTVQFLIDIGADVNALDDEGNTPLLVAAKTVSCSELISTLLKNGAHADQRNNSGKSFDDLCPSKLATIVDSMDYTSLKCLASRVLIQHRVGYKGLVPETLESFVDLH